MFKLVKNSTKLLLLFFLLNGCSSHEEAMKVLPNELAIADECKNLKKQFEIDCYDLIAYKNSFAQIRLGLTAQYRGNFDEAFQRFNIAKQKGNFYANSLLANLYINGFGVPKNEKIAISLLEDVKSVDPIAAYKLANFYLIDNKVKKAIELLTYAGENGVKDAQYQLHLLYSNEQYIPIDLEKNEYWETKYKENNDNFTTKIYGI
jgi:TPR repeat protein